MISEELLREIVQPGCVRVKITKIERSVIEYLYLHKNDKDAHYGYENIYELAHKCKEWLVEQDLFISIENVRNIDGTREWFVDIEHTDETNNTFDQCFYAPTEVEAVFKVTEWVYQQLKEPKE